MGPMEIDGGMFPRSGTEESTVGASRPTLATAKPDVLLPWRAARSWPAGSSHETVSLRTSLATGIGAFHLAAIDDLRRLAS
jgi:hypothetical protein